MITPFHNKEGKIKFPYRALQSIVFIFPVPPPKTLGREGIISLPEEFRDNYQDKTGIVLSVGPGYYDKKNIWNTTCLTPGTKVYFDNTVPWHLFTRALDGIEYKIPICVEADILGIIEDE